MPNRAPTIIAKISTNALTTRVIILSTTDSLFSSLDTRITSWHLVHIATRLSVPSVLTASVKKDHPQLGQRARRAFDIPS